MGKGPMGPTAYQKQDDAASLKIMRASLALAQQQASRELPSMPRSLPTAPPPTPSSADVQRAADDARLQSGKRRALRQSILAGVTGSYKPTSTLGGHAGFLGMVEFDLVWNAYHLAALPWNPNPLSVMHRLIVNFAEACRNCGIPFHRCYAQMPAYIGSRLPEALEKADREAREKLAEQKAITKAVKEEQGKRNEIRKQWRAYWAQPKEDFQAEKKRRKYCDLSETVQTGTRRNWIKHSPLFTQLDSDVPMLRPTIRRPLFACSEKTPKPLTMRDWEAFASLQHPAAVI